jgi:PAS domain S-box-containing protein
MKDRAGETANAATTIESLRLELAARQRELVECRQLIEQMERQSRAEGGRSERWWLSFPAGERHFSILDGLPTLVTLMTPEGELEYANRNVLEYFGASLAEMKSWEPGSTFHPGDRTDAMAEWKKSVETSRPYYFEGRHRAADGLYHWFHMHGFPLRDAEGHIVLWYLLHTNIDCRKRTEALLGGEKRLLEMIATGESLSATLNELCLLAEELCRRSACCSILLLHQETGKLWRAASHNVPRTYSESVDGLAIGPNAGSCGAAAYHGKQVISSDIAIDPQWAEFRDVALANGIRACWSTPMLSPRNRVLGTFAMFSGSPSHPAAEDQEVIALTTRLAGVAVERAQNDSALKGSEARKRAILDSALDCIVTIDHEARITEFNLAAERTFGHRRDGVLGKLLADVIIPPSLREQHRRGFARYLATGEARVLGRRMEMTAVRADGSEFPVELAITRVPSEGPPSFTGYLRDITKRKQSEEKLRRSEAYLSEGQRLSHTGSWAWKVKTKEYVFWSRELYRIYGFDPDAEIGQYEAARERIHPDDARAFDETVDRAIQARSDFEAHHRIILLDGAIKHLHVLGHPVFDDSGEVVEYVGTVMDVTERRRSEEALRKAQANLSHIARLTTVGELTASIAHEVNQPLAAVVTNANACLRWLEHEPPNFEEVRIAIQRIIRDGNRGSDVIKRVRALVKKEHSQKARLDVNEVIRETIALAGPDLQGTTLRTDLAGELPQVQADRVQLQQVLLNLTINALDAMKPVQGRPHVLRLQTKCHEERAVLVVVEDSGIGLNSDGMERLFETFYTTKPGGLGMGLSICRSIIEGHGGRLWAERNEGSGSRFQFTLPIEPEGAG